MTPLFYLSHESRRIPLEAKSYVIGRGSEVDLLFDRDTKLSRRHARLVVTEDGVDVEDLGSMNGTWVNSYLVQHRLRVTGRAVIKLGDVELLLEPASTEGPRGAVRTTRRELPAAFEQEEIPTQQAAAFEHAHKALVHIIESGDLNEAKRVLDPILETVELGRAAPGIDAIASTCELGLRLALASNDAAYVDTVVRIHCAHSALMTESNLELLSRCLASELEPDPRNVDVYLGMLSATAHPEKLERLQQILREPTSTLPAPAPSSDRR